MKMKITNILLVILFVQMVVSSDTSSTQHNPYVWMLVRQSDRMETKLSKLGTKIEKIEEFQDRLNNQARDTKGKVNQFRSEINNLKESKEGVNFKAFDNLQKQVNNIADDIKTMIKNDNKRKKQLRNLESEFTKLKTDRKTDQQTLQKLKTTCSDADKKYTGINTRLAKVESKIPKLQTDISQCVKKGDKCPYGWKEHKNNCYYFSTTTLNWYQSKAQCEKLGAYLVKINNKAENDWLKSVIRGSRGMYPWIGANDIERDGQWKWTSDNSKMTYSEWKHGEPNGGTHENCVHFLQDEKLNDNWCTNSFGYVCEKN